MILSAAILSVMIPSDMIPTVMILAVMIPTVMILAVMIPTVVIRSWLFPEPAPEGVLPGGRGVCAAIHSSLDNRLRLFIQGRQCPGLAVRGGLAGNGRGMTFK